MPSIAFKGSGFYKTDSAKKMAPKTESKPSETTPAAVAKPKTPKDTPKPDTSKKD